MPKPSVGAELRRRLLRAGFSRAHANRSARELQEHWDEIIEEGMRNGLSDSDAQRDALARIGSVEEIANEFTARLEKSSWLGRHPLLGFSLLALTLTILWWVGVGSIAASACGVFSADSKIAEGNPVRFEALEIWFDWIRATGYLVIPWLCCYIAERYFCGWRAALWACLIIAIHNAAHLMRVTGGNGHGTVTWGYGFNFGSMPSLFAIAVPLAIFGLYRGWRLWAGHSPENFNPNLC